jgi:hypothetical protein
MGMLVLLDLEDLIMLATSEHSLFAAVMQSAAL